MHSVWRFYLHMLKAEEIDWIIESQWTCLFYNRSNPKDELDVVDQRIYTSRSCMEKVSWEGDEKNLIDSGFFSEWIAFFPKCKNDFKIVTSDCWKEIGSSPPPPYPQFPRFSPSYAPPATVQYKLDKIKLVLFKLICSIWIFCFFDRDKEGKNKKALSALQ